MNETIKKLFAEYIKTVGKLKFVLFLFSAFLVSVLSIIQPLFLSKIISQIENFLKTGTFDNKAFYFVLISWVISALVFTIFSFVHRYYITDITSLKNHNRVFNSKIKDIFSMTYGEYLRKKTGSIYKNFDRGSGTQFSFIFFFLKDFIGSIFSIIIALIILFLIDIRMTLISLAMLPIMLFFGFYFNRKTLKKQKEMNKKRDYIFGTVGDFLNNLLLSKTLFLENKFEKHLKKEMVEQYDRQKFVSKGWSIGDIYTSTLIYISRILVLGFGTYFVVNGALEFSIMFLFVYYIGFIYFPLSFIFGSFERIQKEISEAERYYKEFENINTEDLEKGEKIEKIIGNIEFKNVFFSYNENKKVFKDLSFSIKKGGKIAFVGNTGAGKTTITNLILRLWEIDSGEILIDSKNIKDISKTSLRKNIGIVTQEIGLYNETIKNNLLYANENASDEEIVEALKKAEANFVFELKDGLETKIGERGMKLSGGEKQRIAIARLFLKNPGILVLDEATSALDNKTEKLVQKALDKLMKNKTSIIIAHRLSTIQNADKIYMLENGKIVEEGNYGELVKLGGKFSELANPRNLVIN